MAEAHQSESADRMATPRWMLGAGLLLAVFFGGPSCVGNAADWTAVASGAPRSCGIRGAGELWCWTSIDAVTEPVRVGTATDWVSVAVAGHICAINADHELWCWGPNDSGQLGDGTVIDRREPVQLGAGTTWARVSVGARHTCAVGTDDAVWCWGHAAYGELGDGTTSSRPPTIVAVDVSSVSMAFSSSCSIGLDGSLWCWGSDVLGYPGWGGVRSAQRTRIGLATDWATVSVTDVGTYATKTDGSLWRLETDADDPSLAAVVEVDATSAWAFVAPGSPTCGIRASGELWCLGTAGPVRMGSDSGWTAIELEWGSTFCGLRQGGLWCGSFDRTLASLGLQQGEVSLGEKVRSFVAGSYRCAVTEAGRLLCEELTDAGVVWTQLGAGQSWSQVAAGVLHRCALTESGQVWCWGGNGSGELGTVGLASQKDPVQVGSASDWILVAAGGGATCAVNANHELWCWGANDAGQLGDGTAWKTTPQLVTLNR